MLRARGDERAPIGVMCRDARWVSTTDINHIRLAHHSVERLTIARSTPPWILRWSAAHRRWAPASPCGSARSPRGARRANGRCARLSAAKGL